MTVPIPHLGNPEDQSLKEYLVTLKDFKDSEDFYKDMETPGGNLYIPDRMVECVNRRPISRNTHYMLTYDEAAQVRDDPRVLTVELNYADLGIVIGCDGFTQTNSNYDKRVASDPIDLNWGLLRLNRKTDISNWGVTGTVNQAATIIMDASGRNVDVVVMDDGAPYPTTYEYAQNPDGTGYSRMVEYNWYQHNPVVTGGAVGNYSFSGNRLQEHGAHTSGNCAGNTQGFARDADIYNLTFYDSIDYVREFHKNKPVNPLTGVKNPTIMNNSWGYRLNGWSPTSITAIFYRGVLYTQPVGGWTTTQLDNFRIRTGAALPTQNAATDADMIEAMNEGVIIVASAGNSYFYEDVPGGPDYDNYFVYGGSSYYFHRGSSPGAANGGTENNKIICSGAIGQHNEASGASIYNSTGIEVGDYKAEFSNYGPRVDVFAPGSGIQSIWNSGAALYDGLTGTDPRVVALGGTDTINNNFKKCPGTSMSCPNTVGVIACYAEKYPRMTQADARALIAAISTDTVLSTNGGTFDGKDAGHTYNPDSCKKMLFFQGTRHPSQEVGGYYPTPFPTVNNWYRPTSGQVYPRKKTFNSYNKAATFNLAVDDSTVSNGQTATVTLNTTNVANGTQVPYIITAKPATSGATLSTTAFSGVYTASAVVTGITLDTRPNTGTRFTTTGTPNGTSSTITNSLLGAAALASSTPTVPGALGFIGNQDDGYWGVPMPWNVTFCGTNYNTLYVGTNTYITFTAGSTNYSQLNGTNPPFPKIMISCADNSCQRIYYGTEGTAPNRTFRIRWEGAASTSGTLGSPNMVYEAVFYENNNAQIDIHTGVNARWSSVVSTYSFTYNDISVPLTGTMNVVGNTASLPITINTASPLTMNVRLGIFPAPNVNITVN
jgi:hypothetical protein